MSGTDLPESTQAPALPRMSVVMPVHNALPFLDAAIESILGQSYFDFEFVILDDASNDGSTERLREWAARDPRIRLLEVQQNLGPVGSSERVARAATAPIVARMDADDIAYPERPAEQLHVLARHPDAGVVGGLYDVIDANGRKMRNADLWRLAKQSVLPPFGNGQLMYRRTVFEAVGGYRKACEYWEDQDLIIRMSAISKVMVIPRAIYAVRHSTRNTRLLSNQQPLEQAMHLAYRAVGRLQRNRDYDDLLRIDANPARKVDPRVFISLGLVALWAGANPRIFRRLLRRGRLVFDLGTLSAIVWTAWASASPATLRAFLRILLGAKNSLASRAVPKDQAVLWSPCGDVARSRLPSNRRAAT